MSIINLDTFSLLTRISFLRKNRVKKSEQLNNSGGLIDITKIILIPYFLRKGHHVLVQD